MEISECARRINLRRGGGKFANVNEKDLRRAVKELKCLGEKIIEVKKIGNKEFIVYAANLSDEVGNIFSVLASEGKVNRKKFPAFVVDQMIRDGQVWVDKGEKGECILYLPPSFDR